jgi:glucose-1-phosphate thymidylyltransferase
MKGIIPTGGRGTRMQPLTFSTNKHFIPLANKPLIFYPIESLAESGIKDIAITYNPGWLEAVKAVIGNGSKWGMKFTFVLQEKPQGLANILEVCEEFCSQDPVVFHLGDNIFTNGVKKYVNYFREKKPNGMVTMVRHPDNKRMGVPYFTKEGRLKRYVEKPTRPPHNFAIPGLYFLDKNAFKCFKGQGRIKPSARGEYEIPDVFQWLIDKDYRVDVIEYEGKWLDPGKFDDWIESNQYLLGKLDTSTIKSKLENSRIQNHVAIGKNCIIKNSQIRGPVVIGDHTKLINAYIGPYTSIGGKCEIINSHVENSVLMSGVKIHDLGQRIDTSLIGTETEVTSSTNKNSHLELFIGEKSKISI